MSLPESIDAGPIVLRRWRPEWADAMAESIVASLPELQPFMPWASDDYSTTDAKAYIDDSDAQWDSGAGWAYAMTLPGDQIVGSCGLMTRMGPGILEIGYWVDSRYAGRGYASAAATALTEVGLTVPGIDRIVINHDRANPASGRVAANAGHHRVGAVDAAIAAPGHTGVNVVWERTRPDITPAQ